LSLSKWVGKSISGRAELSNVKGEGTYVDDIHLPGTLYVGFIRSPYAHAKLLGLSKGSSQPAGVIDVITGKELQELCKPIESVESIVHPKLKLQGTAWYAMPSDRARYIGEPVAAVVVEHPYQIEDALDAISFEYEPLPPITSSEQGLSKDALKLYDDWKDNVMLRFNFHGGDVDEVLRSSDHVLETRLRMHRHTAAPIENRSYLAHFDNKSSFLTMWSTTQAPHVARTFLSGILNFPESNIRVIEPDVGGAFGRGHPIYPEEIMVCVLSMRLGRPIKWVGTRRECLMTDVHSREQTHHVRAGFRKDGTLLAIDDKIIVDMGVFQPTGGVPSNVVTAKLIPGPYKLRNYRVELLGVSTNKSAFGAYRGFGKESAALVYERIMDLAADELKLDRAEIRFRNLIQPEEFPYRNVIGEVYDSGDYPSCFKKTLDLIEYEKVKKQQLELRKKGRYIGIGLALTLCPCSLNNPDNLYTGWDSATITMDPSGNVTVLAGVTSPGTQHATTFPQIVADELSLEPSQIRLMEGDTLICPYGSGNWSDRGATIGGSAVLLAARRLKEKIAKIAAYRLGVDTDQIEFEGGKVYNKADRKSFVTFSEIGWIAHASLNRLPPGVEPGLIATAAYTIQSNTKIEKDGSWGLYPIFSTNSNAVVVEVDPESFQTKVLRYVMIDDSGRIINPAVVEGQLIGAAIQGISGTFLEELYYDNDGQLLSSTLMDYLIASATESPNIEVDHIESPSPITPMGTKGVGESGIVGPYAALCGAVEDALRPFNVKITEMPLSSERLWRLVNSSKST
jgi:carbon-monoxide dehydrogenase large subunit